ncbi:MAG: regulatory protein RecX [Bryobacterales bacterium]|nr:regulatory protein RecX [Bryobacterales bacterium]
MKPPKQLSGEQLWDYALKTLGARAQAAGELREKLRRRAERAADVDDVIARLKEYGFLDDRRFAENYAARRLENEGFGKMRVLADLRGRRVAGGIADQAVRSAFEGTDEMQLAEQFLARKFRRTPIGEVIADEKGMASAYRKLRTAGFSHGTAIKVLKRHAQAAENLDVMEEEPPAES